MSERGKSKVSTEGGAGLSSDAFASLDSGGLPKGPGRPQEGDPGRAGRAGGGKGRVEVRREKAGRGGKTVTTLSAFAASVPMRDLDELTRRLKKKHACGGVLKGRVVELQGDLAEPVMEALSTLGYRPVRAGG